MMGFGASVIAFGCVVFAALILSILIWRYQFLQTCLNDMKWFNQIMCSSTWHIIDVHLMLIFFSPPIFLKKNSSFLLLAHKKWNIHHFASKGKGVSILSSICWILLQGRGKDSSDWRDLRKAYVVEPHEFTWSFCTNETKVPLWMDTAL